jgi:hypothetical protein
MTANYKSAIFTGRMQTFYKYAMSLLSVLAGLIFIYSAYTKLVPIQAFEYTLVEDAHLPRMLAAYAARFFIALEGSMGLLMVLHFFGKGKWVLKMALALVTAFSIYLIYLWATKGNNVNCGCFGDAIWMSPRASLVKNGVLLVVLTLLTRYHRGLSYMWTRITAPILISAAIVTLFIVVPVFKPYKFDFTKMYTEVDTPKINLRAGKHIIAFLSPSCIHCRRAGNMMHQDMLTDSTLPFFMVLGGLNSDLTDFWKASQAQGIPYMRMEKDPFLVYTHSVFPYIIWVNNGIVEEETDYKDLSTPAIQKWLQH